MSHRADEVRKRIAKRKREKGLLPSGTNESFKRTSLYVTDEERYGGYTPPVYEDGPTNSKNGHPLFRIEVFMFKLLFSAVIVLLVAIIFKNSNPAFDQVKSTISYAMEEEFQFAAVSSWYREQFGEPLALFETNQEDKTSDKDSETAQLAMPATGKVLETFKENGQGIMVETDMPTVKALDEGVIIKAEEMPDTGLTMVVQHGDGSESWYGNLDKMNVALYTFVKKGTELGDIKLNENQKGTYYFAIKKGDDFIDPNQVIPFD
ncbi:MULTISPECIES: M23 family metallopeptidase [Bacillaceae]|uniref:M23 family metallopeptidase n=1 Tax=Metabacillus sp. 22489 TaxID=3453928 RepID=UPI000BA58FE9|nr:hypothetical protein CHH83_21100 [Bacillus sp. 7586-K]